MSLTGGPCLRLQVRHAGPKSNEKRKEKPMTDAVQARAHLKALSPQFLMLDLEAAVAFYTEKLGFTVEFTYGDFYVSVQRDGITLHLKLSDDPDPNRAFRKQGEHLDAYIETDDVEVLFSEYQGRML